MFGHRELSATLVYARVHDRTVARDYFEAMAVIEERLAAQPEQEAVQQPESKGYHPGINGNAIKLLRLVSALQAESLTEGQQTVVTALQQGLEALTDSTNSFPTQIGQVVNKQ